MQYKKWFLGGVFLTFFFLLPVSQTWAAPVACDPATQQNIAGVCVPTKAATGLSDRPVTEILTNLMNWLLGIFGVLAIIGFVISGVQYLMSAGDEGMAETAKRNMKYSIIGVIVALAAFVIIQAVDALLNANAAF